MGFWAFQSDRTWVFPMKRPHDGGDSIYDAAHDAIDEEALARVLELATGEGCDDEAVAALHAITAETLLADALAAAGYARRRGRLPTGEDVGSAADKRRSCCDQNEIEWEFTSAKWEW